MRIGLWLLVLGLGTACEADNSAEGGSTDCREATRACSSGFLCSAVEGAWECVPSGAVSDGGGFDPDAGAPADASVETDGARRADAAEPDVNAVEPDANTADASEADASEADANEGDAGEDLDGATVDSDGALVDADAALLDPDAALVDPDAALLDPDAAPMVELAGPGAACQRDRDCDSDDCLSGRGVPGGFCFQTCEDSGDCGEGLCLEVENGERHCWESCNDAPCREGWACQRLDADHAFCAVSCAAVPCDGGDVCNEATGLCEADDLLVAITFEQAIILPAQIDGDKWDGIGRADADLVRDTINALGEPDPFDAVLRVLANGAMDIFERPDVYGTADILVNGPANLENRFDLPIINGTLTPIWGVTWNGVPLGADDDVRVRVELHDSDFDADDPIGVATLSREDLLAALDSGDTYPVLVRDQAPQILFLSVSVIALD